ncbi:glutathione S-transferase U10-like [Impatiens glandulifera]|uniref:glutathione S-transferase U10-like n=1 Tax=Impatiens glandulifera TaxID=253017 RepID=UPI001FB0D1C9|nr:glutathione S-transferase U10-like [Impatiens glandulifera]
MERSSDKEEVLLFGTWTSGYCIRIELALKLKGIPYKYMNEDLSKKSDLLLKYNPIHKKVPVLVHNGKPVAESQIILEYIDETWNTQGPRFLPEDPYERAKIRFWANYFDQKVGPSMYPVMATRGDEQVRAMEDFWGICKVFEQGTKKDFPGKLPFYNGGDNLGFLDILVATSFGTYEAINEVLHVFHEEKIPELMSWAKALKGNPIVIEAIPPKDKHIAAIRKYLNK